MKDWYDQNYEFEVNITSKYSFTARLSFNANWPNLSIAKLFKEDDRIFADRIIEELKNPSENTRISGIEINFNKNAINFMVNINSSRYQLLKIYFEEEHRKYLEDKETIIHFENRERIHKKINDFFVNSFDADFYIHLNENQTRVRPKYSLNNLSELVEQTKIIDSAIQELERLQKMEKTVKDVGGFDELGFLEKIKNFKHIKTFKVFEN